MRLLRADLTITPKYLRTGQMHGALNTMFDALRRLGAGDIDLVVNIGANNGCTVLPLLAHGFAKRALAIEPEPTNAELLKRNIAAHGFGAHVAVLACAMGAEAGALAFEVSPTNKGDHRLAGDGPTPAGWRRIETPVRTLDAAVLPDLADADPRTTLTWMDIQGAEPLAIAGGAQYFARFPLLVTEFNPRAMARLGASRDGTAALFAQHWGQAIDLGEGSALGAGGIAVLWDRLFASGGETDLALAR
ncbi:MAG: FkbM family methyltransferase [Alphaproteobacteria bacterium]|nr:FkbM family methyltransferase [Alphaproteobacteria bacterium]